MSIEAAVMSAQTGRARRPDPGSVARRVLGVLLVAMAIGQLTDIGGFVDVISTYDVGGDLAAAIIGGALLIGELLAGVGLLVADRSRRAGASRLAVVVAVAWSVLAAQAFVRGLVVPNCGCFGVHLAQPLRWWVLVEDLEFVALAWWTQRTSGRRSVSTVESAPDASGSVQDPA